MGSLTRIFTLVLIFAMLSCTALAGSESYTLKVLTFAIDVNTAAEFIDQTVAALKELYAITAIATNLMQELFISALDPVRIQTGQSICNLADTPGTYLFRRIIEFDEVTDKKIGTEKQITSTPEVTIESMTRQNNGALLYVRVFYTFIYVRHNVDSACGLYYEAFIEHDSDGNFIVTSLIPLAPEYENLIHMSEEMIDEHFSRFDAESFAKDYNKKMSMNHLYDFINFTATTQIPLYLPLYVVLITQILTQHI